MMHIGICEDNYIDQMVLKNLLKSLLKARHMECMIEVFPNGAKFLKKYKRGKYDIVFLDIIMNDMNGIEVGKIVRNEDNNVEIAYVTSSADFALASYEVFAMGYVLKPFDTVKMEILLDYFLSKHPNPKTKLIKVKSNHREYKIFFSDILYVDSSDKTIHFNTTKRGIISIYGQLNQIEEFLDDERFLRCHQSYIVNMDHVADWQDSDFILKNKQRVPIRKRERKSIVIKYLEYAEVMI